jgi:hypothetical protein
VKSAKVHTCSPTTAWMRSRPDPLSGASRTTRLGERRTETIGRVRVATPSVPIADRLTDRHGQRTVPGLLLTMVGSTVLGTTLLVRGSAPRLPALLLALAIPLAWLILQATSLGNAALPIMFAFGILGRRLASGSAVADLPAAEAPAR